ncbi:MAG: hypothetical protein WAN43_00365 [Rhodomicrobium sp.]
MSKRLPVVLCLFASLLLAAAPLAVPDALGDAYQEALAKLTPEQQAAVKTYEAARLAYARHMDQYWRTVELKRKKRRAKIAAGKTLVLDDYVKEQPPAYNGPKRPDEIMALLPKPPKSATPPPEPVAVIADFLREADAVYGFKPDRIAEDDFMIAYALETMRLGLTRDQVVRVYALETGGTGTQDTQSGFNARTGRAASTGLGYAQLLAPNSIERVRKEGPEFAARLEQLAGEPGADTGAAQALRAKAAIVRRMVADARKVPENWGAHVAYGRTPKGLAMHALNLDGTIGPWIQAVKLRDIVEFAAKKGATGLTGAQLEMMNLAGPANGFEMMQAPGNTVPTSNFFERGGYYRNPVVHDATGVQLLAKFDDIMDRKSQRPGAQKFARIFDSLAKRFADQKRTSAHALKPLFDLFGPR